LSLPTGVSNIILGFAVTVEGSSPQPNPVVPADMRRDGSISRESPYYRTRGHGGHQALTHSRERFSFLPVSLQYTRGGSLSSAFLKIVGGTLYSVFLMIPDEVLDVLWKRRYFDDHSSRLQSRVVEASMTDGLEHPKLLAFLSDYCR
jgi:hypothetical protein